jgi:hypothetical protein
MDEFKQSNASLCEMLRAMGYGTHDDLSLAFEAADEIERLREDAARYRYLRNRPEDTIGKGGIFAGMTPKNVILTEDDLDRAVDRAMADEQAAERTDG